MYDRRRARVLLAVLTLVSLVLITIDERAGTSGPLARIRDGVATVFAPIQDGLATVVRPVGDVFGGIGELFELRQENAELRAEIEALRERRRSFEDVARENEDLRGALDIRARLVGSADEYEFLAAEVISLAPSNFEWTITLDVGSRDGVVRDMTVIDGDGLVGRVVQIGPNVSRVLLAIDPSFSAASRVARNGENGFIEGDDTDPMRLSLFNPEAAVTVGDEIVTSSYEQATFPDGIPIGAVEGVGQPASGAARQVTVRPYVDFTQLDIVLVILRQPPASSLPVPSPDAEVPPSPPPVGNDFPGGDIPTVAPTEAPT